MPVYETQKTTFDHTSNYWGDSLKKDMQEVFDQGHVLNQAFQIMLSRQDFGLIWLCFLPACVCDYWKGWRNKEDSSEYQGWHVS